MPVLAIGMPGLPELLVILLIVLVLFGAGRLPQVFASFGKGIKSFRDAQRDDSDDILDVDEPSKKALADSALSEAQEVEKKNASA